MRISARLLPESGPFLLEGAKFVSEFPEIDTVNISDALNIRGWQGSVILADRAKSIPHINQICSYQDKREFNLLKNALIQNNINEVLIFLGEYKSGVFIESVSMSIELMIRLKQEIPGIVVYGYFNPYNKSDFDDVLKKLDIGFDGVFVSPVFDISVLQKSMPYLAGTTVFFGIMPILHKDKMNALERLYNVEFPSSFSPGIKSSALFAKKILAFLSDVNANCHIVASQDILKRYLMEVFS